MRCCYAAVKSGGVGGDEAQMLGLALLVDDLLRIVEAAAALRLAAHGRVGRFRSARTLLRGFANLRLADDVAGTDDHSRGYSDNATYSQLGAAAHQLQARPGLVDRANLHVDEAHRQADLADRVLGDVGRNLRGFLRPADPDEARRREERAERLQLLRQSARKVTKMSAASIGASGLPSRSNCNPSRAISARTLSGIPSRQTRMPSLSDSFFASGVPE